MEKTTTLSNGAIATTTILDPRLEEKYWKAVVRRDASLDGVFVFGVTSTGIYCRPSCPARRPTAERVRFFSTSNDAEKSGFRPCLRCKPQDNSASNARAGLINRICEYIDDNLDNKITLNLLSSYAGMSPYHLQRVFKRVIGMTPREYVEARRLRRLKSWLNAGEPVTKAIYHTGYGSSSWLYGNPVSKLGMSPGTYRRGGEGMEIRYTIIDCPLGRLLLAATRHGVCSVSLGNSDAILEKILVKEFPAADIRRDDNGLQDWVSAFLKYFDSQRAPLGLPVNIQATAFNWRVWKELQAIPFGETRTYAEIAEKIGQPSAARAVARACATNPVALVIPCHRIVRKDGTLGGYRWGVERKEMLLAHEKALDSV